MSAADFGGVIARAALRRPVTTCMVFLSLVLLGLIASRLLPLEKFPGIEIPEIMVQVPYPNSTPAEVERLITRPIEEALATLPGIKRMNSVSNENMSQVFLQLAWESDINGKSIEAREKIDTVRHLLPDDVERVLVYQFNTSDMPIFQLRISSQRDLSNAYELLDRNLKRPVERVPGVSKVNLYGIEPQQIMIRLSSERLLALNLDQQTVVNRLRESNFALTAGHIEAPHGRILVNPIGEFQNLGEIRNLLITDQVKLSDLATVQREMPRRSEGRHLDRKYAIGMEVFKESNANLVEVSRAVMGVIDEVRDDPQFNGINLYVMDDTADGVTTSLSDLLDAGLIGAVLSFIVLFLFLRNLTTTFIVVLSVPISIAIALGGMYFFGYSLNILSLMGLMLAVGMLVDNAVVVTESIQHEAETTEPGEASTVRGVGKVALAVIAGTLTTAIVFLPNIIGEKIDVTVFLEHVAISICFSLAASLLISQTLIPLLLSRFSHRLKVKKSTKPPKLQHYYQTSLSWTQDHPRWTGLFALLILASTFIPMSLVSGDSEQGSFNNQIFINYNIKTQYKLAEVEAEVDRMEAYLYDNKESFHIEQVYSYYTPGHAMTTVILKDKYDEKISSIMERIRAGFPTMLRSEPGFGWGNGGGGGVRVTLSGNSTDVLQSLASQITPLLSSIEGLTDVRSEQEEGKYELQININRERVHRLGLTTADVATTVSTALRGERLRSFRADPNGEIPIRVAFDEELEFSLAKLKELPVARQGNEILPLSAVATITQVPQLGEIRRYDRRTALNIGANLDELPLNEARDRITEKMAQLELPSGYEWSLDGSFRRQQEAENVMLTNMILAICMIYIVMAALFESVLLPTAVITSLVLSIVGVFWALLVTGQSITVMAMIGILILMGIVVNNGIVLVDRINQLLGEGATIRSAVIDGCVSRLRPVIMTVATTVLGLIPLAMGTTQIGGDGPPYAPMAIAIIGGLLFSTVTSLYLVPFAYVRLLVWRHRFRLLRADSGKAVERVIKPVGES
ncbi:MAG: efflux RND transporter permease subunit [Idiomarina sp.]